MLDRQHVNDGVPSAAPDASGSGGHVHAMEDHAQIISVLEDILALLEKATRYDFRHYKKSTLLRRIERRMGLVHATTPQQYVQRLRESSEELTQLYKDLLIGVTSFFREPEAWATLQRRVAPRLMKDRAPETPLRIWVPGCASGEEAYTVAMVMLAQAHAEGRHVNVQVFASDIDEEALEIARSGVYPESIAAEIPSEYLRRFFVKHGETYQVTKPLRDCVVFAVQNVASDPPFSKLDMISCRNLLIYLEPELQERIFTLFHFALTDGGVLLLGNSETVGNHDDMFEEVSKKWRIYRKVGPSQRSRVHVTTLTTDARRVETPGTAAGTVSKRGRNLGEAAQQALMAEFVPTSVVINRKYEVLYVHGTTSPYLRLPAGEPTSDLMAMAHDRLRAKLRGAIHLAQKEGRNVRVAAVKLPESAAPVAISARPLETKAGEGLMLVTFEPEPTAESAAAETPVTDDSVVRQLELDLHQTRSELQSTIEELEVSNEELKASNEEVMSMNEELQSINEELETSKEELQSLNEELSTVNNQLRDKVEELEAANDDMTNLLASSEIATLFLDADYRVKRYSPAATNLFKLIPTDVGRPISDVAATVRDADLLSDAGKVLRTLTPVEKEAACESGEWYIRRILPYRTRSNQIKGVVITYTEVTTLKHSKDELEKRATQQALLGEIGRRALSGEGLPTLLTSAVEGLRRVMAVDVCGVLELQPEEGKLRLRYGSGWKEGVVGQMQLSVESDTDVTAALRHGRPVVAEHATTDLRFSTPLHRQHRVQSGVAIGITGREHHFGVLACYSSVVCGFSGEDVQFLASLATMMGLAYERKHADERLYEREEMYRAVGDSFEYGVWMADAAGRCTFASEHLLHMLGASSEQFAEFGWKQYVHPEDLPTVVSRWEACVASGEPFDCEFRLIGADGQWRTILNRGRPVRDIHGRISAWTGVNFDITDRKAAEQSLADSERQLRLITDAVPILISYIDSECRYRFHNAVYKAWFGTDNVIGRHMSEVLGEAAFEMLKPYIDRALSGRRVTFERLIPYRGGARYAHVEYIPEVADGRTRGFYVTVHDRTEARRAQEDFHRLADAMPQIVWVSRMEESGAVRNEYLNARWYEFTGAGLDDPQTPEQVTQRIHPDDLPAVTQAWARAANTGEPFAAEFRLRRHDGEYRWFLGRAAPEYEPHGRTTRWFGTSTEIHQQKLTQETLRQTEAALQTINADLELAVANRSALVKLFQDVAVIANEAESAEAALTTAVERIRKHLGWPVGHVLRPQILNGEPRMVSTGLWSVDDRPRFAEFMRATESMSFSAGVGLPGRVLETGQPEWSAPRDQERYPRFEAVRATGLNMALGIPALVGHRTTAVLEFFTDAQPQPDPALLRVLSGIASQLGRVIEREAAAKQLRESEERFRTVYQGAAVGITLMDPENRFIHVNPAFERLVGFTSDQLVGRSFTDVTHPDDVARELAMHEEIAAGKRDGYQLRKRYRRSDGRTVWAELSVSAVRDDGGRLEFLIRLIQDITARRRSKRMLRRLERQLAEMTLQEQRRIGAELHDGLGQQLTGVGLMANSLRMRLEQQNREEAAAMGQLAEAVREAHRQVRRIARGLSPVEVDAHGLRSALEELATQTTERCGLRCVFQCPEPVPVGDNEVATHLYRIAQEAVNNAVKHSKATEIVVGLGFGSDVKLSIRDNGIGFALTTAGTSSMGLRIIRYRARRIGARLNIASAPGEGTTVTCTLLRDQP